MHSEYKGEYQRIKNSNGEIATRLFAYIPSLKEDVCSGNVSQRVIRDMINVVREFGEEEKVYEALSLFYKLSSSKEMSLYALVNSTHIYLEIIEKFEGRFRRYEDKLDLMESILGALSISVDYREKKKKVGDIIKKCEMID